MSELTIKLQCDPATGKKDIIVMLRSDEDALPLEHEEQHRALVDRLIEGGIVKAGEVGKIIVEREEAEQSPAAPQSREEPQREAQSESSS